MNKIPKLLSILLLSISSIVNAESGRVTLPIEFIGAASATHPVAAVQSTPSVGFDSTTPLGTCPLVDGKVYFEGNPEDEAMFSVLLAQKASDGPVTIRWSDAHTNSRGYCKIMSVRAY